MLEITAVDPHDEKALEAWHSAYAEILLGWDPSAHVKPLGEARELMAAERTASPWYLLGWTARADGAPVGVARLLLRNLDNTDRASLIVDVPEGWARSGVVEALVETALTAAREHGCTWASMAVDERCTDQLALVRGCGWRDNLVEVERRLELPVAASRLDELARSAAARSAPHRVVTHEGALPEAWLPSYAALKNRMGTDAPSGDVEWEPGARTPDTLRQQDQQLEAGGSHRLTAAALDPDGSVVGCCELVLTPGSDVAEQWGTIVAPAARGHRLGMAMKVAVVRALQEVAPDVRRIVTTNVEDNRWMIAINDELGFRVHRRDVELTRPLDG